jgi:hypothetical protein
MLTNYAGSETLQQVYCTSGYRFDLYTDRSLNLHQPTDNLILSI